MIQPDDTPGESPAELFHKLLEELKARRPKPLPPGLKRTAIRVYITAYGVIGLILCLPFYLTYILFGFIRSLWFMGRRSARATTARHAMWMSKLIAITEPLDDDDEKPKTD
jgi:hypothetical protein